MGKFSEAVIGFDAADGKKLKKILYVITLSELGGAQKIVYNLIRGLHHEYEILLACAPGGELVKWSRELGVKVYGLTEMKRSISPWSDLKTLLQLMKIIKLEKPEIVHCHSWKAGILGRLAAFLCRAEHVVFTVHGWSTLHSTNKLVHAAYCGIERLFGKITESIVCVSEGDKELGIELRIAPREKFTTIYNGIAENGPDSTKDVKRELKIPEEAIVVGTIARLSYQKMIPEAVDLMSTLLSRLDALYFIWVGDGPLYHVAKERASELGISNRFLFAGNQENVYSYLSTMDIYILLSRYEGLSVSILEAMSMGLPVVASDVGGVKEQIQPGVCGYIINNTPEEIVWSLEELIKDKEKRVRFGQAGRQLFLEQFTIEKMVEGYRKLYETLHQKEK